MNIIKLWHDDVVIEWGLMLLIGLFFLAANCAIFLLMLYIRTGVVCEYGFPKRDDEYTKRKQLYYSRIDRILLIRLTRETERKGWLLYLTIVCHYICLAALIASFVGFAGCMLTLADGWALTLLVMSEYYAALLTGIVEFYPHYLCLPSERKRYRL
jgi:hypothetical protein